MKKAILALLLFSLISLSYGQFIVYQPEILGGSFNYNLIYNQEFYYPAEAIQAQAEGEVKVSFLVEKNGFASGFQVLNSVYPSLDRAYIDVLKHILWVPGTSDGVVSDIRITKSAKFKIKKYQKLVKKRAYDQPPFPFTPFDSSLTIIDYKKLEQLSQAFYNGKEVNINKFISEYIKVPAAAAKQDIKGIVELEFVIEPSGRLSNFKEIVGAGGGCTEEAIRLMQMLQWQPGMLHGDYVRSNYYIKVNFGHTKY